MNNTNTGDAGSHAGGCNCNGPDLDGESEDQLSPEEQLAWAGAKAIAAEVRLEALAPYSNLPAYRTLLKHARLAHLDAKLDHFDAIKCVASILPGDRFIISRDMLLGPYRGVGEAMLREPDCQFPDIESVEDEPTDTESAG